MGRSPSFAECLKPGQDLRKAVDADPDAKRIVEVAQGLEGIVRNNSIHAAAVVIADRPLDEIVPLQLAEDRGAPAAKGTNGKPERQYKIVTQYSMGPIEEIGLLKMDFLGLRNLDVIEDAVDIIRRSRGVEIEMESIPLDDAKTYEMLARGDSVGVFQLESEGMQRGAQADPADRVQRHRRDRCPVPARRDAVHPRLRARQAQPVLGHLPGPAPAPDHRGDLRLLHLPGAADGDLEAGRRLHAGRGGRPAQGGRQEEARPDGDDGGQVPRGLLRVRHRAAVAKDLWSLMTAAADYSFNKSHAACYALISYRTAYLKANYPAEYMAAVISSVMSTKDKVPFFVNKCNAMEIEVLPPDVNSSDHGFVVSGNSIRFGLDAVKNVGHAVVETIIASREGEGPFESIWDFCERVDARAVNKRAIECLVKCGALDSTGDPRRGMLEVLAQAQSAGQKAQEDSRRGQGSIFDLDDGGGSDSPATAAFAGPQHPPVPGEEFDQREKLRLEKETLGTFVSAHPLGEVGDALRARVERPLSAVSGLADGAWVTVGGIVAEAKKVRTRRGGYVMFAGLDDLEGRLDLFVRDAASEPAEVLELDRVVVVRGRIEKGEEGKLSLNVQEAEPFEPGASELAAAKAIRERAAEPLLLKIDAAAFGAGLIDELKAVFGDFPGENEVLLEMRTRDGVRRLRFGTDYRVAPSAALRAELDQLLGPASLAALST